MNHRLIATLALVIGLPVLVSAQKAPKVRIHFWTAQPAPGSIVDLHQSERDAAVEDLQKSFNWKRAGKLFEMAPKDGSQVQVEVVTRGYEARDGKIYQGKSAATMGLRLIVLHVRAGTYDTKMECRAGVYGNQWRNTANDCIEQLKAWAEANRAQLKPTP